MVSGALTLDGTLNIADAGGFSQGVYRVIDYGGALTDNGLVLATLPTRFVTGDMLISTATPGEVNLIVSSGGFGLQFWDGPNTLGNGAVDGGSATWNNATTNWTSPDGSLNAPWQGGFAVFEGTAGHGHAGRADRLRGHAVPHRLAMSSTAAASRSPPRPTPSSGSIRRSPPRSTRRSPTDPAAQRC